MALRAAGLVITGVSIGRENDRTTWAVTPSSLQAAAQPIIDTFVAPTQAQLADDDAIREVDDKKLKAAILSLWECIPSPTMTKAQLRSRIIAIYKTL